MAKLFVPLAALLVALACAFFAVYPALPVSREDRPVLVKIPEGASTHSIAANLERSGIVRSALYTRLYARVTGKVLKAGSYRLSPSMSAWEAVEKIASGRQEAVRVTIPEGLTISKIAEHLERAGVLSAADFDKAAHDPSALAARGIRATSCEGFLFPDTYFFPIGIAAPDAVAMMVDNFFAKIERIANGPASTSELFERVVLASIVEREYRVDAEAPLIASVFENRTAIGMGLQSCATIEYIITEIQKKPHPSRLRTEDLEIESDYNTYKWAGLPPGPISNPGLVALDAAINPAKTKYLYFRLTDPDAGTHSFTRSLDEHVRAGRLLDLKKAAGN